MNIRKIVLSLVAAPALLLASSQALAGINTPPECGNYDFNANSFACKFRTGVECSADCSSLNFQAGCEGGCKGEPIPGCTDPCANSCLNSCDPATVDCYSGCNKECEQPFIDKCMTEHPERDCVTDAKASCSSHCRESCASMSGSSTCQETCTTCCHGSCTSYENMTCDIGCYAKLEGGCTAQCSADGALMCKDKDGIYQFVNASDVNACINALVAQGLQIDLSAKGEVKCDLSGCDGTGNASAGGLTCSAMPGQRSPYSIGALALSALGAAIFAMRRRRM